MAKKNAKQRRKEAKGESVQTFLPVRDIRNGMVETTDGRYLKILEIEPINFALRSSEEQFNIISSFASWLKISPVRLQCKTITRRADSDKHIALVREELAREKSQCRALGEDYRGSSRMWAAGRLSPAGSFSSSSMKRWAGTMGTIPKYTALSREQSRPPGPTFSSVATALSSPRIRMRPQRRFSTKSSIAAPARPSRSKPEWTGWCWTPWPPRA